MNILKYFSLKKEIKQLEDKLLQMQQSIQDFGTICLTKNNKAIRDGFDEKLFYLESDLKRKFAENYSDIKIRLTHHGRCLGCKTPLNKGCGACRGCTFFRFEFKEELSDLFTS